MGYTWSPSYQDLSASAVYVNETSKATYTHEVSIRVYAPEDGTETLSKLNFQELTNTITTYIAGGSSTENYSGSGYTTSVSQNGNEFTFTLDVNTNNWGGGTTDHGYDSCTFTRSGDDDNTGGGDDNTGKCTVCGADLNANGTCSDLTCPSYENTGEGGGEDPGDSKEPQGGGGCVYNHDNGPFYFGFGFDTTYNAYCKDFKWWYVNAAGSQISEAFSPELIYLDEGSYDTSSIEWELDRENPGPKYVHAEVTLCNDYYDEGVTIDLGTYSIFQYFAPEFSEDAAPSITTESGKLTREEPWTLSWPAATELNGNSPVKGYYMRLIDSTDGRNLSSLVIANENELLSEKYTFDNDHYHLSGTNILNVKIDPKVSGIQPNHKYFLNIAAYTQFGSSNDGGELSGDYISSVEYTAKNNGVLYVKVNGEWQEGQVYMKVPLIDSQGSIIGSSWAEAEAVYTRNADGEWEESTSL